MIRCNKCGGQMVPVLDALIPALGCVNRECRRVIPATGVRSVKGTKAELNRALRAARRASMRREAS